MSLHVHVDWAGPDIDVSVLFGLERVRAKYFPYGVADIGAAYCDCSGVSLD
jgi:hypothetical protein